MVVALLYEMQSPSNCFTLSLSGTIVIEAIVGETTTMLRWRSRCRVSDDGDRDGAFMLELKGTR